MSKKRNYTITAKALLILLCVVMVGLFQPNLASASQKTRFAVGFTTEQALESTRASSDWQYSEMGCIFWPLIYDQLWIMGPAPDYKPMPDLATRWETKDRKTWTFYLRKDAKFTDGKPVTAEDVAFTLKYLPKNLPSFDAPDRQCSSIKVIDAHTIQFTLKKRLGGTYPPVYWVPILPKHIWWPYRNKMKSFKNLKAIGSGPFKLKAFKSKQYVWFVANKSYWGKKPGIDELILRCYGNNETLNMALLKGEIQMIGYNGIYPLNVPMFKGKKNIKLIVAPGIGMIWLSFNLHKKSPIHDVKVRKAIMYAINVSKIRKLVYLGYAERADSFVYPELPTHNPNLPQYKYNPEKAKKLLEAAGLVDKDNDGIRNDPKTGKDVNLTIMVPTDWVSEVKTATMIKEQLKAVGLGVTIKAIDLDTYYDFLYKPKEDKADIMVAEEEPGPNADWIWELCRSYNHGGEGWNESYYNNPAFDKLLNKYLTETNVKLRKKYVYKMQEMISNDLPYGFLVRPNKLDPVRTDKFEGYVVTMGGVSTWINPWTYFNIHPKKK